jgi:RNA polymerase sigma-70 factor (ECF subfamily)
MSAQAEFDQLFKEYKQRIHHYMVRMVGESAADDVTQDVFIKVNRALFGFKGESSLSTWVYRIATNTALDHLRSRAHQQANRSESLTEPSGLGEKNLPDLDASGRPPPPVDETLVKTEMTDCIREFVDDLPPDYRAVIALSELKDLPNQEIATPCACCIEKEFQ